MPSTKNAHPRTRRPLTTSDGGYVICIKGEHEGKVMYYDDDVSASKGVFYLGRFLDGGLVLPRSYFRKATLKEQLQHEDAAKGIWAEESVVEWLE